MKTLVMDLDGTLIDSIPDVCIALNFALASVGYNSLKVELVKTMVGGGARQLVEKALSYVKGDPGLVDDLCEVFKSHYSSHPVKQTTIYPGVVETLERLVLADYKLGICTNKPEATTFPVIEALNLTQFFPVVVCGDSRPYKKPDARHVFDVIDALDSQPEDAVFIGDSETDVAGAKNAGVPIVVVSYGYSQTPASDIGADQIIHTFTELPGAISEIEHYIKSLKILK